MDKLAAQLKKRTEDGSLRSLKLSTDLVDFCSNDYLGLSKAVYEIAEAKVGSTGSRLLAGHTKEAEQLEEFLAIFHESTEALVFNSGYVANLGFFSCIPQKGDVVLYDELIHTSVKDGLRLSYAKYFAFKHNDVDDLKLKLERFKNESIWIVVESVYSMDGDKAPLEELVSLKNSFDFKLFVDEAHAVGVYGEKGEGLVQTLSLSKSVDARLVTFGKAVGCHGAAVLSDNTMKNYLVNFSRPFIYSTAIPQSTLRTIFNAYQELQKVVPRKALRSLIQYFNEQIEKYNIATHIDSDSAIHCVLMGTVERAKKTADLLQEKGLDVRPILSPTVPKGKERLRVCLHSFNTKEEIDDLFGVLSKL